MEVALLDPEETSVELDPEQEIKDWSESTDRYGRACRHRHASNKRDGIAAALALAGESPARVNRFKYCGAFAWVWRHKNETDRYRIKCLKCHDRFCTQCCYERGRMYARAIADQCVEGRTRFITLTLRHCNQPLVDQLDKLYSSFRRLRQRKCWRSTQEKSIAFTEISFNLEKQQYHVHLHILSVGSFLNQKTLSDAWVSITGDSFIVDVRRISSARQAAQYVCKYACKGISANVLLESNRAAEVITALRGRRLIIGCGDWKKIEPERDTLVRSDWEQVGTLGNIMQKAAFGDEPCQFILMRLGISVKEAVLCIRRVDQNSS